MGEDVPHDGGKKIFYSKTLSESLKNKSMSQEQEVEFNLNVYEALIELYYSR